MAPYPRLTFAIKAAKSAQRTSSVSKCCAPAPMAASGKLRRGIRPIGERPLGPKAATHTQLQPPAISGTASTCGALSRFSYKRATKCTQPSLRTRHASLCGRPAHNSSCLQRHKPPMLREDAKRCPSLWPLILSRCRRMALWSPTQTSAGVRCSGSRRHRQQYFTAHNRSALTIHVWIPEWSGERPDEACSTVTLPSFASVGGDLARAAHGRRQSRLCSRQS